MEQLEINLGIIPSSRDISTRDNLLSLLQNNLFGTYTFKGELLLPLSMTRSSSNSCFKTIGGKVASEEPKSQL